VVSGVRRMNEVNAHLARLYSTGNWMGDRLRAGIPSRHVTSQPGQLSLASLRGRLIEYQLRLDIVYGGSNSSEGGAPIRGVFLLRQSPPLPLWKSASVCDCLTTDAVSCL